MRERHRNGLDTFLRSGEAPILGRRIETSGLRSDGSEFPVELIVTQVADVDPPLFNGYLHDITDRRKAADELAASRERLVHIAGTLQSTFLASLFTVHRGNGVGREHIVPSVTATRWVETFTTSLRRARGGGRWLLVTCAEKEARLRSLPCWLAIRYGAAAVRNVDPADVLEYLNQRSTVSTRHDSVLWP